MRKDFGLVLARGGIVWFLCPQPSVRPNQFRKAASGAKKIFPPSFSGTAE
jgi:hypothetical protein